MPLRFHRRAARKHFDRFLGNNGLIGTIASITIGECVEIEPRPSPRVALCFGIQRVAELLPAYLSILAFCAWFRSRSPHGWLGARQRVARISWSILCDDLGYGDLACYGDAELKTPNIDRLAREGLRLTSCYAAAANCSPARTGLMTGRTPTRVGVHNWIPMFSPVHVRRQEITVATLLRNAGYDTGHFGKWHLNGDFNLPSQPQPWDHGFNYWFSTQNNALPNHRNPNNFVRNGKPVGPLEGYAGPLVTDEAIHWLKDVRDKSKPFFMYVCYHEPHEPIATDKQYTDLYPSDDPSYSAHHGNITQMDDACGQAAADDRRTCVAGKHVRALYQRQRAGHHRHPPARFAPARFERRKGIFMKAEFVCRESCVGPDTRRPGKLATNRSAASICCRRCARSLASIRRRIASIDGASFLPILNQQAIERERPLYWHFLRASSEPKVAMRVGDWKLLAKLDTPPLKPSADILEEEMHALKTAKLAEFELYNLTRRYRRNEGSGGPRA